MNYKEKYEKAVKDFKKIKSANKDNKALVDFIEYEYPELKVSEDEEIRNYLIDFVRINDGVNLPPDYAKKALAWLEKQKDYEDELEKAYKTADEVQYKRGYEAAKHEFEEQSEEKPADKVETKFRVGDWVVVVDDGRTGRIIECTKDFADVGLEFSCLSTRVKNIRSWTIQDAKDGDILSSGYSNPFIFSGFLNNNVVGSYCGITRGGNFHIPQFKNSWTVLPVLPATKEQRDLLFSKMKEVGYEWDAEKKELKKIEQKPAAWSEEDEDIKDTIIRDLKRLGGDIVNVKPAYKAEIDWLKSLKERYTWKPSDEQMEMLENVRKILHSNEDIYSKANNLMYSFEELIRTLMKLREE